jgi:phospholipase C
MPDTTSSDDFHLLTRRRDLGGAAAGATALAVAGTGIGRAAAAATDIALRRGVPRNPAESGIEHVVVLMMENRSFDHMLGWLPGSLGRQAGRVYRDRDGIGHQTWHLDTFEGLGFSDPNHSYNGGRSEFNGGKCDGWLRTGNNDIFSIGYYLQEDLSFYGNAAPYWTVCDRFFASIMGPTYPNRFYMHAGQTDRQDNRLQIDGEFSKLPTIWGGLQAAGLDGRYYYSDLPFTALWGGTLTDISAPYADFVTACSTGSLPEVSFVDPRFLTTAAGPQNDDHPHADIRRGQHFMNEVYENLSASPTWEKTVFVITYDEWGGFYDHIPPRVAPDANPANGLRGFRIPSIVISPMARRNHIAHNIYDTTSILKMIEWRWGLPALSPRDAAARNLAEVLDFANTPDLTAPRWDVPDIDADSETTFGASARAGSLDTPTFASQRNEQAAEWEQLGNLAASNGFAV